MRSKLKKVNSKSASDKLSLNPQREEDDRRACEQALADPATKEILELAWYKTLHAGETLRNQKCDMPRFRTFGELSKFSGDRGLPILIRAFDAQMEIDEKLLFVGFVKAIFHMGMEKFATPDYTVALKKMIDMHINPFIDAHRKLNDCDGTEPDDRFFAIPEVDRFLYVFDLPIDRLFVRYRDNDKHQTRELTLEQVKILDQFMELDEVKEFLKDFGFFPKIVSYADMSKVSQYACFGRIAFDPTKQRAARVSSIEIAKKDQMAGSFIAQAADASVSVNPLFIPSLPIEYQSEVLIDKPRLMSFFIRLSQLIFTRPEWQKVLPSIVSRVEEVFRQMAPAYEKMFGRSMESDCDFTEKGVPVLMGAGALSPETGHMKGAFEITISGTNFCEKRGVFVRFGGPDCVVRAKMVTKRKIVVDAPQMKAKDVEFHAEFHHGQFEISMNRVVKVFVECSNNRWEYSNTDPLQQFTFREACPKHTVSEEESALLMKLFAAVCSLNDRGNTKLMSREKWRFFKQMCSLTESLEGREDYEPYFLEVAEYLDGAHDLSLSFKGLLRVLPRVLLLMHGDDWRNQLSAISKVVYDEKRKVPDVGPILEQNEVVLARRAIGMVERRSALELDVFLGPVLCGVVRSRPGDITSSCSGHTVTHVKAHPFLSYDHMELNTEVCVMRHLQVSQSITHLVKRLENDGFDFAAHHPKVTTRKPAGRCWAVRNPQSVVIGAVWDYEGNYSCLEWQPAEKEMYNEKITMSINQEEKSTDFIVCYLCYSKAKTVQMLRGFLEAKNYTFTTKLYAIP